MEFSCIFRISSVYSEMCYILGLEHRWREILFSVTFILHIWLNGWRGIIIISNYNDHWKLLRGRWRLRHTLSCHRNDYIQGVFSSSSYFKSMNQKILKQNANVYVWCKENNHIYVLLQLKIIWLSVLQQPHRGLKRFSDLTRILLLCIISSTPSHSSTVDCGHNL